MWKPARQRPEVHTQHSNHPLWAARLAWLVFSVLALSGCSRVVTNGNYDLPRGETISGSLVVTAGNVTLEEGTRVTGSVWVTAGNLAANGRVDGDVIVTAGNILLGPQAFVGGQVFAPAGDIQQSAGADVRGASRLLASSLFTLCLLGLCCCLLPALALAALVVWLTTRRR